MDAVNATGSELPVFNWVEYTVFSSMLALSTLMGIYFGIYKGNQDTVNSYILGDKNMGIFPIAMSLIASHVSGITLIGVPAEVYMYGTQYYVVLLCDVLVTSTVILFFIPVFYKLQLNSVYEYLEMRFSHGTRVLGSLLFALYLVLYIPVVIYVPAIALNQVTGFSVHYITPLVSTICIFYTTLGGLKGVSWTVALQSVFTVASLIFIIFVGCYKVGGIGEVFRISDKGHRLEIFNMDPNPFARNTFWTVGLGCTFTWLSQIAVHPGFVQKFISVPTQSGANKVMFWAGVGIAVIKSLTVLTGLLMFANYYGCDPLATKAIQKSGQLLPYYVLEIAGQFHGLTGLFIAGVFSAALSTMSTCLNTVAGTIYEDLVLPFYHSEEHVSIILKLIVILVGALSVSLVFVVENLGGVLQIAISIGGLANGTLLTMFVLGMFCPWADTKAALAAAVTSFGFMLWIGLGSQMAIAAGKLRFPGKATSIDDCPANFTGSSDFSMSYLYNYTGVGSPVSADDDVPTLYTLSYMYYCLSGTLLGLIVGLLFTLFSASKDLNGFNPDLLAPPFRRFVPKSKSHGQTVPLKEYQEVSKECNYN